MRFRDQLLSKICDEPSFFFRVVANCIPGIVNKTALQLAAIARNVTATYQEEGLSQIVAEIHESADSVEIATGSLNMAIKSLQEGILACLHSTTNQGQLSTTFFVLTMNKPVKIRKEVGTASWTHVV